MLVLNFPYSVCILSWLTVPLIVPVQHNIHEFLDGILDLSSFIILRKIGEGIAPRLTDCVINIRFSQYFLRYRFFTSVQNYRD